MLLCVVAVAQAAKRDATPPAHAAATPPAFSSTVRQTSKAVRECHSRHLYSGAFCSEQTAAPTSTWSATEAPQAQADPAPARAPSDAAELEAITLAFATHCELPSSYLQQLQDGSECERY